MFWQVGFAALWFLGGVGIYSGEIRLRGATKDISLFIVTMIVWPALIFASLIRGVLKGLRPATADAEQDRS